MVVKLVIVYQFVVESHKEIKQGKRSRRFRLHYAIQYDGKLRLENYS